MNTDIILDASIIVALYLPEEYSSWAQDTVNAHRLPHILDLTMYEVFNALWKASLRKKMPVKITRTVLTSAKKFMKDLCRIHSYEEVIDIAFNLSLKHGITVYDASYLALAKKLGLKLATLDKELKEKLKNTELAKMIESPFP